MHGWRLPARRARARRRAPDATPRAGPRTRLGAEGRLRFEGAGPARLADCGPEDACVDTDADRLSDAWEAIALDRLRPRLVLDEEERLVEPDSGAVLAFVGRVAPAGDDAERIRVYVMIGYSEDYGSCGLTAHHGDSERVVLDLAPLGPPGGYEVVGLYTAAHEGTVTDHSRVYRDAALVEHAVFTGAPDDHGGEPRWTVYPSADKHGTYIDVATCEGVSIIPCLDEDCAPDGVAAESLPTFTRLPPVFDAGEPDAPRLNDLAVAGFPGDDAWAEQDFCGGLSRDTCSAAVRDKLLVDPFVR